MFRTALQLINKMLENLKSIDDLKKELQTQARVKKRNENKIKELQDIIEVRDRRIKVLETQLHLLINKKTNETMM